MLPKERCFEGDAAGHDVEEFLIPDLTPRSLVHKRSVGLSFINVLFMFTNIVVAVVLYSSYSSPLSPTNAEYGELKVCRELLANLKLTSSGPLRDLVKYRDQQWDLSLGIPSAFTKSHSAEVDALWDSISAPPGDGEQHL